MKLMLVLTIRRGRCEPAAKQDRAGDVIINMEIVYLSSDWYEMAHHMLGDSIWTKQTGLRLKYIHYYTRFRRE